MKMKDVKAISCDELDKKVKEISEELFRLKFQHGIRPLDNTAKLQQLRKDIARLKTALAACNA